MISERRLAETYTSFWHDNLRTGEAAVKFVNGQLERVFDPIESRISPRRREFINEAAFFLFTSRVERGLLKSGKPPPSAEVEESCAAALKQLARLRTVPFDSESPINHMERNEVVDLGMRLEKLFTPVTPEEELHVCPPFAGCGIVKGCYGDVLKGSTLHEIKSGDRNFRLIDLRQLFIYGALNYAEPLYKLTHFSYVNPRRGVWYREKIDNLVHFATGKSTVELFSEIVDFITSDRVSM